MGGKVSPSNPNIVRAAGPGHSKHDDSLAVILSDADPEGFYTVSFAGDDWRDCRDHVRAKLGLPDRPPMRQPLRPILPKPKGERTGPKRTVAEYVYLDRDGNEYHKVVRDEWEGGAKTFRQEHWEIESWVKGDGGLPPIPYNLPDLIARHDEPIWLVEGEKNADDLTRLGLLATTAKGGASAFPRTTDFAQWFDGSTVYAIPDNDEPGRKWLEAVKEAIPHAQVVTIPGLPEKGDVSDWIASGGTAQRLVALTTSAPTPDAPRGLISPTPFQWVDPKDIKPREWLYDAHLIRKFVSLTVSPGGLGKSSLALVEAMSMAAGKALFQDATVHEPEPLRVWYWNGEDPQEETQRRVVAAAVHYDLAPESFASRLFTDSGREQAVILGQIIKGEIDLDEELFLALEASMIANRIDVLMLDPFVSAHRMGENDNNAIDAVVKRLGKLADRTNAAVEIVHHVRKPSNSDVETEVNDARGASALLGGVRSARVLNVMSKDIARVALIPDDLRLRHFSVSNGKANMSAKSASSQWRFLESVCLSNERGHRKADNVGVVTYYALPEVVQDQVDLSGAEDAMRLILSQDDCVRHWTGKGPKPKNWIGHRILEALNIHDETKEPAVQKLVRGWLTDGIIVTRSMLDKNNRVTVLTMKDAPFTASDTAQDQEDTPF